MACRLFGVGRVQSCLEPGHADVWEFLILAFRSDLVHRLRTCLYWVSLRGFHSLTSPLSFGSSIEPLDGQRDIVAALYIKASDGSLVNSDRLDSPSFILTSLC